MARQRKRRRARGEGSVYFSEAKGVWVAKGVVAGARREATGRTQGEAVRKLAALRERGEGPAAAAPFAAHLDRWLDAVRARDRQPTTLATYSRTVELHLKPALGAVRLDALKALHLEQLAGRMLAEGYSRDLVKKVCSCAKMATGHARRSDALQRDPFAGVRLARHEPPPRLVLTPAEAGRVIAAARGRSWGAAVALLLTSGLRRSELLALEQRHLDLAAGTVKVEQALYREGAEVRVKRPKSRRGLRVVSLPPATVGALRAHLARHPADPARPLFPNPAGGWSDHSHLTRAWKRALKRAGLAHRRLHDARHSHASALLRAGVPITAVAARLGDSVATVATTYAHDLPGDDLAELLPRLYPSPPP